MITKWSETPRLEKHTLLDPSFLYQGDCNSYRFRLKTHQKNGFMCRKFEVAKMNG